jgi:hypothetical protein
MQEIPFQTETPDKLSSHRCDTHVKTSVVGPTNSG